MDLQIQLQKHYRKGYGKGKEHYLGSEQKAYFRQLSETAGVKNIPDVIVNMHKDAHAAQKDESLFRKYKYNIINDKIFTKEKIIS